MSEGLTGADVRCGALVGAAAAMVVVALMFALRLTLGVLALPDIAADAMTLALPGSVFGFLIDRLQEYGRPLMLVGLSLGLVVLGAVAGVARGLLVARLGVAQRIAAVAGGLCALTLPPVFVSTPADLALTPAVSTVGYWALYAVVVEATLSRAAARALLPHAASPSRRALLYGSGAVAAVWLGSFLGDRILGATARVKRATGPGTFAATPQAVPAAPATPVPPGATPAPTPDPFAGLTGITTTKDFYVISKNGVDDPVVDARRWRLLVGGARPYMLSYDELQALPRREFPQTLECISNVVGGPLISTAIWRGAALRELLERAGLSAGVREIRFNCADGYTESLPLETAIDPTTIVAYLMNGEPLTKEHGFPARLVLSGRFGMKQPKWLTGIVPVGQPYNGFWEQRGWSKDAFVRTFSRLDHPQEHDGIPAGKPYPLVRGVAYAGSRGISKAEISFDGGRTWDQARLRPLLEKDDWVPFTYEWTPPAAGVYTVVVRATDGDGELQDPQERESFPDGATGYHRVKVTVV